MSTEPVTEEVKQEEAPVTFDTWLGSQDETVKGLIGERFKALENTVSATRGERDTLAKEIKGLAKTQAEGSEARKSLDEISAKLEQTERRADFIEEAIKPDIQCRNPRAAWLLAQADSLFDSKGRPDWGALKREAPELFGPVAGEANAGTGTKEPIKTSTTMNDFIRGRGRS